MLNEKLCGKCKSVKPADDFNLSRRRGLQAWCKACSKIVSQARYRENKDEIRSRNAALQWLHRKRNRNIVNDILGQTPCIDCGEPDLVVLEFDHVRPGKKHEVSDLIRKGYSLAVLFKELALCEVRCANCHRRRTDERRRADNAV